jgi:hypothetical protein
MADKVYRVAEDEGFFAPREPVSGQVPASVSMQTRDGRWVPAIPEPLWVGWRLRRARCLCGRTFRDAETYQGHYALEHILLDRSSAD